jgi:hypothetical protein
MHDRSTSAYVFQVEIQKGSTSIARLVEGFSAGNFERQQLPFLRRILRLASLGRVRRIR